MPSATIYGTWVSAASRGAFLTAQQLGLDFKIRDVDLLAGEHRQDWYKQINPQMLVPLLEDGDFRLPESRAISAYLVNSRAPGSALYPTDARKRAIVDQRLYFDATVLFVRADNFFNYVMAGATEINEHHREKLLDGLAHVNRFLTGSRYLAGDELTIADLHTLSLVAELFYLGAPISNYPEVQRWWELCKTSVKGFEANAKGSKDIADFLSAKLTKRF